MRDGGADSLDHTEDFMTEDQEVESLRSAAVEGLINLHVGRIDPDLESADQDPTTMGDVIEPGLGKLSDVGGMFDARANCQRSHDAIQAKEESQRMEVGRLFPERASSVSLRLCLLLRKAVRSTGSGPGRTRPGNRCLWAERASSLKILFLHRLCFANTPPEDLPGII